MFIEFSEPRPEWIIGQPGIDAIQIDADDFNRLMSHSGDFLCEGLMMYADEVFGVMLYHHCGTENILVSVVLDVNRGNVEAEEIYRRVGLFEEACRNLIRIPYESFIDQGITDSIITIQRAFRSRL